MPTKEKKGPRKYHLQLQKRSRAEDAEIKQLEAVLKEQAPPSGSNPLAAEANSEHPTFAAARKFDDLPLSQYTKEALREAKFVTLTAIQRAALPHALCGRDVLGAAKTGSGKTLAFLIPVLECLFRRKWNRLDGLGALVASPTRELALQIFEELRKVGRRHELSAGLLIGGKDIGEEAERVAGMNILVATPGRLLQHMDETPGFDASELQVLVLDEADRILDLGFSTTLNAILANLPRRRQTLLFSATQTKSLAALARLSLKDPEYVEAHAQAEAPTPVRLEQAYMECALPDKLNILWSFIKTHLRARSIVFFSTCKQVRFVYEAFRRLRPGVPLRALHGHMSQYKRMAVYQDFCAAKVGVLFATDVAARGLDFPSVDWVVQADCPEDVAAYIHRVGRTARYASAGRGLLLLLPSEREGMLAQLAAAKVPVKALKHNPDKLQPVTPALQALLSKDAELKETAQRSLVSYLRSVFLQPNRAVFDVTKLPAAELALSIGLPTAPKLRFLKRAGRGGAATKGPGGGGQEAGGKRGRDEDEGSASGPEGGSASASASDEDLVEAGAGSGGGSGSEDELLVVKRRDVYGAAEPDAGGGGAAEQGPGGGEGGSRRKKRLRIKPNIGSGSRVVFDEEGRAVDPLSLLGAGDNKDGSFDDGNEAGLHTGAHASVAERAAAARAVMMERDREDRATLRELRKAQRDAKRSRRLAREQEAAAVLVGGADGSDGEDGTGSEGGSSAGAGGNSDEDRLLGSDGSDSDTPVLHSKKRPGAEVAHLGMVPAAVPRQHEEGNGRQKRSRGGASVAEKATLAEQEALVLQILRR